MTKEFTITPLDDGAVFTIDRAAKLNALTKPVLDGLSECLRDLEERDAHLLVVTGSGDRALCAGTDLAEMVGMTAAARFAKSAMARDLFVRLSRSRIVSVAAINGLALGGGLELAMACTLRIAVPHATFSLPEIKLGLLPAYAGTQLLPAIIGRARAEELILTGRTMDQAEALAMGLIHRATASPIVEAAIAFAREVTCNSPVAVAAIRDCIDASRDEITAAGLDTEDRFVRAIFGTPDTEARLTTFLDRKRPA